MTPNVRPLVAGNWKMNGTRASLDQIKAIAEGVEGPLSDKVDALICPPATLLYVATALVEDSPLEIGAQDCHQSVSGAHTGDVSAEMIADVFASYVIVGHSERRTDYAETDHLVRAKAEAAHAAGLTAIICIGETAEERQAGQTLDVLKRQLAGSVPPEASAPNTVIAYEPVWAIGTGEVATPEDAQEVCAAIRGKLAELYSAEVADAVRVLYGGSVKSGNAAQIIGGASLKAADFLAIYGVYEDLLA